MIDKNKYGIIYTPGFFVEKMLNLIPELHFSNPDLKWLDVGAGNGIFSITLFNKLDFGLENIIPDGLERYNHIVKNMIFMCEIYPPHIETLLKLFCKFTDIKPNIITSDFLTLNSDFILQTYGFNKFNRGQK